MKSKEDFLTNPEFVRWVRHPSPELELYWSNWIAANPDSLSEFLLAKEIMMAVIYDEPGVPEGKKQELLSRILKESPKIEKNTNSSESHSESGNLLRWVYRAAAVVLFSIGLVWLMSENKISESSESEVTPEEMISRATKPGEKLQFSLEDGTRVWINSSTVIRFPKEMKSGGRKFYLEGEAYFEVSHDSLRPFQVFAGDLVTTVLGTSFNVTTKESDRIKVALLEGKVSISHSNFEGESFLEPGEMLQYKEDGQVTTTHFFDIKEITAWRNGLIQFKNASIDEVLKKLEDWYGVHIAVENPQGKKWKVNAEYQNETLENILSSLSYVHKFKFELEGKNVKLIL
ncbi:FecR family protein [Lunatibacter salilacus]|uniref:FecR family protein n=1 Tax=Lunatibacter salilacus TaxID=2483804 RepID=UPI00131DEE49|nr:FecR family protein [Lunatibacter salilacus]